MNYKAEQYDIVLSQLKDVRTKLKETQHDNTLLIDKLKKQLASYQREMASLKRRIKLENNKCIVHYKLHYKHNI